MRPAPPSRSTPDPRGRARRPARRRSRAAAALLLAVLGPQLLAHPALAAGEEPTSTTSAPAATPDSPPDSPTSDSTVLAANAYPGVQLVTTTYTATVSVPMPVLDQAAVGVLAQRVATQALSGVIGTDQQALTAAIVDAIADSPDTYFDPGPGVHSRRQSLTGTGTGWAITPDGYLITAAHVVSTPKAQLRAEFADSSLTRMGRQFVRGLQGSGIVLTPDQTERLTRSVLGWFAARMRVDDLDVSVAANIALGFDGLGKEQRAVEAEVVDVGKPYPGNDVALLKIDGQQHLPTIDLGNDDDVSPGVTVHVVGFPAASTFSPGMSRDSQVQPTVTQGPVTAVKSTGSGMPVFQTQAPASPGNSGGPVLTDDGAAVGVLVAGAVDSDGSAAQGQMFVIPASEVSDMLDQNGVSAERSDTTQAYADAVDAFYADRFKEALPLFERVESLYPAHPFAAAFVADAKTAIDEGRDRTPAPDEGGGSGAVWVGVAVAVAVLAAGGVIGTLLLLRRRRRRLDPGAHPAAHQAWGPPPGWSPAPLAPGQPGTPGYPPSSVDPGRSWPQPGPGASWPGPAPTPTPGPTPTPTPTPGWGAGGGAPAPTSPWAPVSYAPQPARPPAPRSDGDDVALDRPALDRPAPDRPAPDRPAPDPSGRDGGWAPSS